MRSLRRNRRLCGTGERVLQIGRQAYACVLEITGGPLRWKSGASRECRARGLAGLTIAGDEIAWLRAGTALGACEAGSLIPTGHYDLTAGARDGAPRPLARKPSGRRGRAGD